MRVLPAVQERREILVKVKQRRKEERGRGEGGREEGRKGGRKDVAR